MNKNAGRKIPQKIIYGILSLAFLYSFTPDESDKTPVASDSKKSLLALYGEQVFIREGCNNCHSLLLSEKSKGKNLDGLSGKYPDLWHYLHLEDPSNTTSRNQMPGFPHLLQSPYDRQLFNKAVVSRYGKCSGDSLELLWNKFNTDLDSTLAVYKKNVIISPQKSEVLALIAYLQQIPASPLKVRQDSIYRAEYKMKMLVWDSMLQDSTSLLFKTALNTEPKNIKKGAEIFHFYCSPCHSSTGDTIYPGSNLTDEKWNHGSRDIDIIKSIVDGFPDHGMRSWKDEFKPEEVGQLVAYIKSINKSKQN